MNSVRIKSKAELYVENTFIIHLRTYISFDKPYSFCNYTQYNN